MHVDFWPHEELIYLWCIHIYLFYYTYTADVSTSILAHILYLHWRLEYIHSGSYLILTLMTWVHPFWLISYTYTDDVSTSILAHILYLHWRLEYIHSGSYLILTLTTWVHPFWLISHTYTDDVSTSILIISYTYTDDVSTSILAHALFCYTLHIHTADGSVSCLCLMKYLCAPHDSLCLSIWIESTDAVTSCRSVGTHSCGERAYRSSCNGRCCWLREYINSDHILYLHWRREYIHSGSCFILLHITYTQSRWVSVMCLFDEASVCATWWVVFVYLNRVNTRRYISQLSRDTQPWWGSLYKLMRRSMLLALWVHPFWLISYTDTEDISTSILAHILYWHWGREYIHSGSYLILTLTTWVHPFWLISYTYTDDMSTSILAHILY